MTDDAVIADLKGQLEGVGGVEGVSIVPLSSSPTPTTPTKSRVSVVESVYYQSPGQETKEYGHPPSTLWVASEEDPYVRRLTVGEEWQQLDAGWLADSGASLFHLRNEEGKFTQVIPTEEQREEARGRVVEVGVINSSGWVFTFAEVYPQDPPLRLRPADLKALRLRCRNQKAKVTIVLIPR